MSGQSIFTFTVANRKTTIQHEHEPNIPQHLLLTTHTEACTVPQSHTLTCCCCCCPVWSPEPCSDTVCETGRPPGLPAPLALSRLARIWLKCSEAERISRLAAATSSRRPVTTKTGSSPRTGVLMYVLVLARSALIFEPVNSAATAATLTDWSASGI